MKNIIKVSLTVMLFLCLLNMSYGYYQLVRIASLVGFLALAYFSHKERNEFGVVAYVALAILFQPFFKIYLGREIWNAVDVVVGAVLVISIFVKPKRYRR